MKSCTFNHHNKTNMFHNQSHTTKIICQKSYRMNYIPENISKILSNRNTQDKTYIILYLGSYGVFHIDNHTEVIYQIQESGSNPWLNWNENWIRIKSPIQSKQKWNQGQIPDSVKWIYISGVKSLCYIGSRSNPRPHNKISYLTY